MEKESMYRELSAFYQNKRDFFRTRLRKSRFKLLPCSGTYFQLADYSGISSENDLDFTKRLTKDIKVASIPTSVFYNIHPDQRVIRFCFAKKEKTLEEAADRLCNI
jgi:methionine aminotransferase